METTEASILVENGFVLTMDGDNRVYHNGSVVIRGNAIIDVGSTAEIRKKYTAAQTIDASRKVVMPGLVDTYGHAGHGLIKGIYHPERGWPGSELYFHQSSADWWYAEGRLSALERLRFGVTTGLTVVGGTPARVDSPIFAERQIEAVAEAGVRSVIAVGPPDPLVSHLPNPWSGTMWQGDTSSTQQFTFQDALDNSTQLFKTWNHAYDERIQMALHYPYLFGRQAAHPRIPFVYNPDEHVPLMVDKAEEIKAVADTSNILLHSHAFVGSVEFALKHYGEERVHRLLQGKVLFAHCNGLKNEEIKTFGDHRTGVSVVPFTHENILYGLCPAVELLDSGAKVSISTDGTAPYCSYDLFKDLSRAVWGQWMRLQDQSVLPPGKVLRMATIEAAEALGMEDLIGSIEAGKRADLILIDLDRPHLVPNESVPRLLVFYTNGNDVDTVIVNGQTLMQNREVLSVDEQEIVMKAKQEAAQVFQRRDVSAYLQSGRRFWMSSRY